MTPLEYFALKVGFQRGYREINKIFMGNVYPKNPYLTSKAQYLHCLTSKYAYFEQLKKKLTKKWLFYY